MEGGEETPGTMSSDDFSEAVDSKRPCADDCQVQAESTEKRIKMATAPTRAVTSGPGNNEPEERTEGTTAAPTINVHLTGVTRGAVDTYNVVGVVHRRMDNINTLNERTKEKIESYTAGMVRVSAVDDVLNKMKVQRWITITGNAGDGKTVLGYLVLKEFLLKNVRSFTVYRPKDYDQIAKMKEDKVIMFDDSFGAFLADDQLIKNWFDVIKKILKVVEGENPKLKVIFISRKNVVNESKVHLKNLADSIFARERVIDLSKKELTVEKPKILEYHLGHENVTVDPYRKKKVFNMAVAHGFPQICRMFSRLKSMGYDVHIEEYFESPLEFLDMTTKVLYNETCRHLFQLMVKNDGELNVYDIEDIEDKVERQALLEVEKEQEGSYITVTRNGICQFAHPSVYESVLNVINGIDPLYCVQYATLSVIRQKMIISTSDEEDSNRAPCYIIVMRIPSVLKALAERFQKEIFKGDYSVFEHRLCQSKEFCEALVSCCVRTNDEKENLRQHINTPGKDGRTMLWTALLGGIMSAFCVLVQAGADIEIADESGCTPLLYLSKQDELDGDSIRMVIRNRADLNVKDEKGATPLLYLLERDEVDYALIREVITTVEVDCDIQDERKTSPLRYLCSKKRVDIETLMLMVTKSRADIKQTDEDGDTPLHWLSKNNNVPVDDIKTVTVELSVDINKQNCNGSTPLHFLCARKVDIKSLVSLIQEAKGDINMEDEFGNTPLHYLCFSNNKTASYLLEKIPEANPNIQNDRGYTAYDYLLRKVPVTIINNMMMVKNDNYTAIQSQIAQFGSRGTAIRTTFFSGTTTGGRVPRPNRLEILARTTNEMELTTAGMIRVAAVDEVINKFDKGQHWVTITGNAGEGKTTLGYLVLKKLQREEVYTLYRPEEYDQIENIDEERVIMLDDRFGKFQADPQKIDKWFDVLDRILCKTDTRKTKVIFISRTNVLKKSKNFLGHLTDGIFDRVCVVDISKRELTENVKKERMKILDYHLRHEKEKTKDAIKKRVCNREVAHGFPRCCKMFEKVMSNRNNIPIVDFFRSPLKFLDMTTKVLYDGNCQKLFKMMIKNDGQFDINTIEDEDKREELYKIKKEQEGSYIRVTSNGICQFAHQSVYESVLNVINGIDPLWCVQYATLSVVRQNMIISTSDEEEDSSRSSSYIIVKQIPVVLNALAERFHEEMLKGDYSVFGLRLCQSKVFCEALVTCVCFDKEKNEKKSSKEIINKPGEDGKNMLWAALSSGNMIAVCVIMDKGANIVDLNVRDNNQRTPLHYLLEHQTIHKEALDIMIRDLKRYLKVRDISGCTPLHYLTRRTDINVHVDLLKLMLSEGKADLNQCEQNKSTPLHYLCSHPDLQPDTLRLVVQDGKGNFNSSDEHGTTPLHYIFQSAEVIKSCVNTARGDLNKQDDNGITPLHVLCKGSLQVKDVLTLFSEGDKADMYGNTPLHFLCRRRGISDEEIQQLKQLPESHMKKQNKLRFTPLDYLNDQDDSLAWTDGMIARTAADLVLCRVTSTIVLAGVIELLVNTARGDINKQDGNGITPLHVLCMGSLQMGDTLQLIRQGHKADIYGNTPLHFLCKRKGINAEVLQQIPKINMTNNFGYTPRDYLIDKGPAMSLSPEKVHEWLQVGDFQRELTNMFESGLRNTQSQFLVFQGTCSRSVPLPPPSLPLSPFPLSTPSYWETLYKLRWTKRGETPPILEMGLVEGKNLDIVKCVSAFPNSFCVSVEDACLKHINSLCIQVRKRDKNAKLDQVGDCVSLPIPTSGAEVTLTFGLVLDVCRERLGFIDVEREELLCKIVHTFTEEVVPMFYLHRFDGSCATRMTLVSGRQIFVCDRKIQLIQQALSD